MPLGQICNFICNQADYNYYICLWLKKQVRKVMNCAPYGQGAGGTSHGKSTSKHLQPSRSPIFHLCACSVGSSVWLVWCRQGATACWEQSAGKVLGTFLISMVSARYQPASGLGRKRTSVCRRGGVPVGPELGGTQSRRKLYFWPLWALQEGVRASPGLISISWACT